jgi:hypothetical protein
LGLMPFKRLSLSPIMASVSRAHSKIIRKNARKNANIFFNQEFIKIMKSLCYGLALAAMLTTLGGYSVLAQDAAPQAEITLAPEGVTIPAELPEGVVNVSFTNNNEMPAAPLLARLNEGVTMDDLNAAFAEGPMGALPLLSLVGGSEVPANSTLDITYDFAPGSYVLLDMSSEVPNVQPFTVADAEGEGAAAPEADVQVKLLDFTFSVPTQITTGPKIWQVENQGEQWHEMFIGRVDETMSIADYKNGLMEMMMGGPESEPVFEQAFIWTPMNQGERGWFELDLEPGTYVVVCFLPDFASGHAHLDLGMVQLITVTEAA